MTGINRHTPTAEFHCLRQATVIRKRSELQLFRRHADLVAGGRCKGKSRVDDGIVAQRSYRAGEIRTNRGCIQRHNTAVNR